MNQPTRNFIISLCALVMTGCAGTPAKLELVNEDEYKVEIYQYYSDHHSQISKQLKQISACAEGFKVRKQESFAFGCGLGDCRGERYFVVCN